MKLRTHSADLTGVCRFLWAAMLLTLPVTSFRYFPAGEGTFVRPLAFFPLVLLLATLCMQALLRKLPPPRTPSLTPLAVFLLLALATSLLGMILAPLPIRGQEIEGRTLRAWITMIMGVAFFVASIWMNRTDEDLRFSVRWILAGLVIDLLWSGLQAATFYLDLLPKPMVTQWQRLFSLRELIRTNRISGMAYEPSWLAGQIATIYLPWLLASSLTGVRVTRFRWLEPLLLAACVVLVFATYSRGGILTVTASVALTLLIVGRAELRAAWMWFRKGWAHPWALASRLLIVAAAIVMLVGAGAFLAQKGYVSRLWETRAADLPDFLIQNSAGARGAYLASAMQTYAEHPWTGVGLGAAGFYMYSRLPDWSLTTVPEIARQLNPESALYPNPKSLYVRLLAETGVVGAVAFLAFQLGLLGEALSAARQGLPVWRYLGAAAICTWLALLLYNTTQDSFATPNLWINLGILAGVSAGGLVSVSSRRAAPRSGGSRLQTRNLHSLPARGRE